jgi:hypothetical protein
MTKKMTPNTGMINIEELGDPNAFRSEFWKFFADNP